jgi:hypothetical protein
MPAAALLVGNSEPAIRVLRQDRLGGLLYEYLQVA